MESFGDNKEGVLSVHQSKQSDKEEVLENAEQDRAASTVDRIWLGFESGD